jgi:hypothetical protein
MKKQKSLSRSAYDLLRKSNNPSVWLIFHLGQLDISDEFREPCGKIVTAYTLREAPSGGYTCYATVYVDRGPLEFAESVTGRAGGYGYDKESAAVADAFDRALPGREWPNAGSNRDKTVTYFPFAGAGMRSVIGYIESFGYHVVQAL